MSGRRDTTRQRLFTAATGLIAERGFAATTVDAIAERAGVAKGTVYYNFPSKSALFEELLRQGVDRLAEHLAAGAGAGGDRLSGLIRAELDFIGAYETFARVLLGEMWRTGRDWPAAAKLIREKAIGVYAAEIRAAQARGDLRKDLDSDMAATAVFGMTLTVALEWRALDPDRPLDDVHATLVSLLRDRVGR
ncbi:MAG TPA: helix-turn-helix domain-containing protein [Streptosporangiaceae bacterium]|jgi:AcrR family transcriptional regulator